MNAGSSAENFFDGKLALVAISGKQLTEDEVWKLKEIVSGHFGLTL